MIDDDYDIELPPIFDNVRAQDAISFTMPSADALASQRAREEQCERELRELYTPQERQSTQCSDSSGSEGESALAAAVDALRMHRTETSTVLSVNMIQIINELLEHLPKSSSQFIHDYLEVLRQGDQSIIQFANQELLSGVEAALLSENSDWEPSVVLCCGAWLSAVSATCAAGSAGASGLRLRRALHALLQRADDELVAELARVLCAAVRAPRLLLELGDAAQGAPGRPARLARLLLQHALDEEGGCSYTRIQLAGRVAASAGGAEPPALPPAAAAAGAPVRTEELKVAAGAAKLQLLFHAPP